MSFAPRKRDALVPVDDFPAREPARATEDEPSGVRPRKTGDARTLAQGSLAPGSAARLRELLHQDRRSAGEARDKLVLTPLIVSTYTTPLYLLWRRWFRAHRKALRKAAAACLTALATVTSFWLGLLAFQYAKTSALAKERSFSATQPAALLAASREESHQGTTPVVVFPEQGMGISAPSALPAAVGTAEKAASLRVRLVRADALLRDSSLRAAREARMLLEWTLPEVPEDAHARAALAEACLRLHDEACARTAISEALELRPRRSRYRALAKKVERAFQPCVARARTRALRPRR